MLQVTDAAVSVFRSLLDQDEVDGNAIRLFATPGPTGEMAIAIEPVDIPETGDAPTEAEGLDVFVAQELEEPLREAVLDVRAEQGDAELFLRPQE